LGAVSPTCPPRSLMEREKGARGPRGASRKMTGGSIRCSARIRPLHQARTGFGPNGQTDGRQPFMPQEYLTTPAFEDLSLLFRSCEAGAAALVGRVDNAFHPATDRDSIVPTLCKSTAIIWLIGKSAPGVYR
jgi:hypothetical protein